MSYALYFYMRGLSLLEDGVPLRVTQLEGSDHIAALNFPSWYGWPCLGSSPDLAWPKAKSSQLVPGLPLLCVLCQEPLPGPWPFGYRELVVPVLVEIFVAWIVSGSHNPTHSEWPRQVSGREFPILSFVTFQTVV